MYSYSVEPGWLFLFSLHMRYRTREPLSNIQPSCIVSRQKLANARPSYGREVQEYWLTDWTATKMLKDRSEDPHHWTILIYQWIQGSLSGINGKLSSGSLVDLVDLISEMAGSSTYLWSIFTLKYSKTRWRILMVALRTQTVFYRKTSALNPPGALYPQAHVLAMKYHRIDNYPFMIFGLPRGLIQ